MTEKRRCPFFSGASQPWPLGPLAEDPEADEGPNPYVQKIYIVNIYLIDWRQQFEARYRLELCSETVKSVASGENHVKNRGVEWDYVMPLCPNQSPPGTSPFSSFVYFFSFLESGDSNTLDILCR